MARVEGTITDGGITSHFIIGDVGYHQWGADNDILGERVDFLGEVAWAARSHLSDHEEDRTDPLADDLKGPARRVAAGAPEARPEPMPERPHTFISEYTMRRRAAQGNDEVVNAGDMVKLFDYMGELEARLRAKLAT